VLKHLNTEQFSVNGATVCTTNKAKASVSGKIAGLWGQFYASYTDHDKPIYAVYSNYESDVRGEFTITAGTKEDNEKTQVSAWLSTRHLSRYTHA